MQDEEHIKDFESRFSRENPFSVPDGYFDRFALRMSERIAEEKKSKRFPFPALLKPAPVIAFATLLILGGIFSIRIYNGNQFELSDEEISRYVYQEGIDELDLDEIIEYSELDYADTIEESAPQKEKNKRKNEKELDEIQKYLLDEDIDLNDIINEF
ncbi:MAG: hypothetical protein R2850_02355 [Bacteroidia bacterium]